MANARIADLIKWATVKAELVTVTKAHQSTTTALTTMALLNDAARKYAGDFRFETVVETAKQFAAATSALDNHTDTTAIMTALEEEVEGILEAIEVIDTPEEIRAAEEAAAAKEAETAATASELAEVRAQLAQVRTDLGVATQKAADAEAALVEARAAAAEVGELRTKLADAESQLAQAQRALGVKNGDKGQFDD